MTAVRGTSNGNESGSSYDRRSRKNWMLDTFRAEVDVMPRETVRGIGVGVAISWIQRGELEYNSKNKSWVYVAPLGEGEKACRCYRCGLLLTYATLTVDRIIPKCKGGTYRRNNIRPACGLCNSETGGALSRGKEHQAAKKKAATRR